MKDYLTIQDLSCGYPPSFRLGQINFSLHKGRFAGIIGPNGSGKTTLFKGICGDLPLLQGNIQLDGRNIRAMGLKDRAKRIAVVTQTTEALDIPVEDYVLMGRMPYRSQFQFLESKQDHEIAEKYMKLTDVYHLRNKHMLHLSGGEQQLAAIARAFTQEPDLLLLDEPTSHLDISHQVQILNLIQSLSAELGLTVLMIIHDLNLAGEYCDYLMLLNKGKLHSKGTPEEVLTYTTIEEVYETVVITQTNPLSKRPVVFLVSNKMLLKSEENKSGEA
ncbi:MAG: ABC transporter ATP-binding protein [Bacteroidales bacterium]|nr:ABC transporter ATP-binding protein [Bacteroidales bacterium]